MQNQGNVLMSASNPAGWKLEELLAKVADELVVKNHALENNEKTPVTEIIVKNNDDIISRLRQSVTTQNSTMAALDEIGPNEGPTGKSRI